MIYLAKNLAAIAFAIVKGIAIVFKNICLLKYKKRLIQNFIRQNWEDFWKL